MLYTQQDELRTPIPLNIKKKIRIEKTELKNHNNFVDAAEIADSKICLLKTSGNEVNLFASVVQPYFFFNQSTNKKKRKKKDEEVRHFESKSN